MREYDEERLFELKKEQIPYLIEHNIKVLSKQWPVNLYESIFAQGTISLSDGAEKALISALKTLATIEEQCVLNFYKERKPWYEICDELNIYVVELNEHICKSLRKLRHPSRSKELAKYTIFQEHDAVSLIFNEQ